MNKKLIIPITACFLLLCVVSAYGLVGHSANQILPGIFNGDFTIDGLLNVTGNIVAAEPTQDDHVATRGYVLANSGGTPNFYQTTYEYQQGRNADTACDAGYHMCLVDEMIGRTYNTAKGANGHLNEGSWIDTNSNYCSYDCEDWSTHSSGCSGLSVRTSNIGWFYDTNSDCGDYNRVLCCSD